MENNKRKVMKRPGDNAKNVGAWARTTEYIAKALVAVVGLAVLVIGVFVKSKE